MAAMRLLALGLAVGAVAKMHDKITKEEWDSESQGKRLVFLDMYAEW